MAGEASRKDEDVALAADGEEDALLADDGTPGGSGGRRATSRLREEPGFTPGDEHEDDTPAPETGLHALGQLGTAVLVVGALVLTFLAVALAAGWIFR
jgi:hypothetical protein